MLGYKSGRSAVRAALTAVAALCLGQGVAFAQDAEKCFDKATLTYFDCPKPAEAAPEEPMMAPSLWTGPYLGIHGGYAWGSISGNQAGSPIDLDPEGFLIGAQAGYLHEFENHFTLGAEIDFSWLFADDSQAGVGQRAGSTATADLNWLASARLRAGYAMDTVMPYVTGGLALADYDVSSGPIGAFSLSETALGGVVGGGIDWLIDPNVVLRAEGLYYFFDDDNTIPAGSIGLDNVGVARVGLSYKF